MSSLGNHIHIYASQTFICIWLLSCASNSRHLPIGYFRFDTPQAPKLKVSEMNSNYFLVQQPVPSPTCPISEYDMAISFAAQSRNLGSLCPYYARCPPCLQFILLTIVKVIFQAANITISHSPILMPVFLRFHLLHFILVFTFNSHSWFSLWLPLLIFLCRFCLHYLA